ncbi:hypothetical protein chiPu_0002538 [Chiloscyllium punctatum]|uniref:Uncharacterized protein n=1 Tax=Chiloscyllium punctatum TaxID=137246 RepID=A0A401S184_CHIPU|nr:hypothetical protein [Chiloscyllium punctatum]
MKSIQRSQGVKGRNGRSSSSAFGAWSSGLGRTTRSCRRPLSPPPNQPTNQPNTVGQPGAGRAGGCAAAVTLGPPRPQATNRSSRLIGTSCGNSDFLFPGTLLSSLPALGEH